MISVIIPCTRLVEVQRAIESVESQIYKNVEIIVVNDNPLNDLDFLKEKYTGLILINNSKNIGLSASRNIGIDNAKGEYIYFLDDDDYLDNANCLYDLMILCKNNNTDIAITSTFGDIDNGEIINKINMVDYYMSIENDNVLRPVSTKLYKIDYIIKNRLKFIEGYVAEEDEYLYRLLILNPSISVYNQKVYHYSQDTEKSIMKSVKYKCDKSYIDILSREVIEKSELDGMVKAKALMNINNSNRKMTGINMLIF